MPRKLASAKPHSDVFTALLIPALAVLIASAPAIATPVAAHTAAPQAAGGELPAARDVIDRHIEAIGGRDAIQDHTSSYARGSIEVVGQGLVGTMEIFAAAPNHTLVIVDFPAVGVESRTGYNGEVGWSIDPMTGERLLQGGELQQLVDEADYYGDLHAPEKFTSMETVDQVEFDGRPAYKLELVHTSGRHVLEYFDVETGRLIGVEGPQESLMGTMNAVTTLGEYQSFGDLMVPTSMYQDLGGLQTIRVTIEAVELDNVDPAVFALPPAIEALRR